MNCVIIGSGVAAIAAIDAIRSIFPSPRFVSVSTPLSASSEADGGVDLTLIGDDPHGFYSRPD
ncbi:MAG TPA: hypothetical protein VE131_14050, partial [Terriglobales bacterium]|nr:hypothetical protein [Terriglobales bacterium]